MDTPAPAVAGNAGGSNDRRIFWGCFFALVACAFGFVVRTQIIGDWATEFGLTETEKGDILGVGFWPFAFSIFLFSLVIDNVGYGRAAAVGFVLHLTSTLILIFAHNAEMLYWGTFLFALSNGTVEAYINPAVASMKPQEKTKWLNILHAGWPGGIALAGMVAIALGDIDWQWKVGLTFVPTAIYAFLLIGARFPISERVAAGVSYRQMLQDFGGLGAFVAAYLIALQALGIVGVAGNHFLWALGIAVVVAAAFGFYVRSFGQPIYFLLLLIMIPLATTELGIDSWITELMGPEMSKIGLAAGWVLVYTAVIMTVLRLFAGPIVHRLSPLGLLTICSALAIGGLLLLSTAAGIVILIAATVYGVGKTFFWPTMLGVVAERFPRGGALTLNCIGGVGMLGLSIGGIFLGIIQDHSIEQQMLEYDQANQTELHATYVTDEKSSVLGSYRALDVEALGSAPDPIRETVNTIQGDAKKSALSTAAIFPTIMLVCYIGLVVYFKMTGGYKSEVLVGHDAADGEKFTGGAPGPADL